MDNKTPLHPNAYCTATVTTAFGDIYFEFDNKKDAH